MKLVKARYDEPKINRSIIEFKGYNNSPSPEHGEYVEGRNISSRNYPCLSPRKGREEIITLSYPNGMGSCNGKLFWVDGNSFYYDGVVKGSVANSDKQFLYYNDYILIWPDKKYYDVIGDTFGDIENTYTSGAGEITFEHNKIITTGADFSGFSIGDGVVITGCTVNTENNKTPIIRSIAAKELTFSDNAFTAGAEPGAITIKRSVPDIDFIAEHENRVWGCKGNDIYASKFGDFKNWNVFDLKSTDSYAVDVGSEGNFTGILKASNHLAFSKEKCIHKMFGDKPENFKPGKAIPCSGVQEGGHKSIADVNGTICYLSSSGYIMGYTGGLPFPESRKLGDVKYFTGVAGSDGRKYYCSLDGTMYVMDTWQGNRWDVEDSFYALDFTFSDGYLYVLSIDGKIYKIDGGSEGVSWYASTGPLYETIANKHGNSKISVLVDLHQGSYIDIYKKLDNEEFELVKTFSANSSNAGIQKCKAEFKIERAQVFQIRLAGTGDCKVYGLQRDFYVGSDV